MLFLGEDIHNPPLPHAPRRDDVLCPQHSEVSK